jgi:ribosome-binding protein aMBF1 (putative translation factor)
MMDAKKRQGLEAAGWRVGSTAEFLDLTPEESALIEFKLSLGRLVKQTRVRFRLSQLALAQRLNSSQSRVAKVEAGDAGVSLDLIVKAALAAGAKRKDVAKAIARSNWLTRRS